MIRSELDAAGVTDPSLREAYEHCRMLNAEHGKTFFLATRLLAPEQRPAVHALYGFARRADDILDDLDDTASIAERAERLQRLSTQLFNRLVQNQDCGDDPTLRAVVHTARRYSIPWETFDDFLASMRMDLTIPTYGTWDELLGYMDGSAAVIGEMLLPVLEPTTPEAIGPARDLGLAFQLTNFLRDVAEDLDRGRVYLPKEDLDRFGADPHLRTADAAWCGLMRFEIDRCRTLYRSADEGLDTLPAASAACVRAARVLYSEILDRIESQGYDVFTRRATVPTWRKAAVAAQAAIAAR